MTDPLTKVPYNKPLIDFSPIVVGMRMENQDTWANVTQYLINRCERDEQRIASLESMLRELEWADCGEDGDGFWCHKCGHSQDNGHAPDCRLKKLLEE